MTYSEAEALILEHTDYGGSVDRHALALAIIAADRATAPVSVAEPVALKAFGTGEQVVTEGTFGGEPCPDCNANAPGAILEQVWNILMDQKQPHLAVRMKYALKALDSAMQANSGATHD
jgi:hypothetical protein